MSCTCNKSPNCDPCAFCLPPGVVCLPDCNPKDPCGDDVVDLCCVKWAGSDYPCSFIEKGDPLCDIIFKILAKLFPPDRCCYFDIAVTLLVTPTTTVAPTTLPPPTTTLPPVTTTAAPTTTIPPTTSTTTAPPILCIAFDGGDGSLPQTLVLTPSGTFDGKPKYTFGTTGCVRWDTATLSWLVLLDCNSTGPTSLYAYLNENTPTPAQVNGYYVCLYNPSGGSGPNCEKFFGGVSVAVNCSTDICYGLAGEAVGLVYGEGFGDFTTISSTGMVNGRPSYSFTVLTGGPSTIQWSSTNNRWEWTINASLGPIIYVLNLDTYVPLSGTNGWECVTDPTQCGKLGIAFTQQGPCPPSICAIGVVPCIEPYGGEPPCVTPFYTGEPYIDDNGYYQKINGKDAYVWNFLPSQPDKLIVFWTGVRWEARLNLINGTLIGFLASSTLNGVWTVITSTGQYIKETYVGNCCNCVDIQYPQSFNSGNQNYSLCNNVSSSWSMAEAGPDFVRICTNSSYAINYPDTAVFGTPIVSVLGRCDGSNDPACGQKLCFSMEAESNKLYATYQGSTTLFNGRSNYKITNIQNLVSAIPVAYVYFNSGANRWELGANLGGNTVSGGTLYAYITAITPPTIPYITGSNPTNWTMTGVLQNTSPLGGWEFKTRIPPTVSQSCVSLMAGVP